MIDFNIRFRNPFPCRTFRGIVCWTRRVTKNKYAELQFSRYAFNWFELGLDLNWRQIDHAGPWITVNLFGWTLDARIYDHRHWDDMTNTWAENEST